MENLSRAENSPSKLINYFLRFHGWEFTKGHKLFETKISRMGIHQPFLRLLSAPHHIVASRRRPAGRRELANQSQKLIDHDKLIDHLLTIRNLGDIGSSHTGISSENWAKHLSRHETLDTS